MRGLFGRISTMTLLDVNYFRKKAPGLDVRLDSKCKFMPFFFQPHTLHLCINASYEPIAHGITVNFYSVNEVLNFFI